MNKASRDIGWIGLCRMSEAMPARELVENADVAKRAGIKPQ